MSETAIDLVALSDFALVAAHGGFGRAHRASGRSKATLSRRVAQLENALGVRLIERGPRALRLTEAGALLFGRMETLLAEVAEVRMQIVGGATQPRGRLRISAPLLFAHVHLGALAADFHAAYPDVQLEATTEDRRVDLVEEGYDAVIRVNPPETTGLVGRCFLRDHAVVVSSPGVLGEHRGEAEVPAVLYTGAQAGAAWLIAAEGATRRLEPRAVLRLPSLLMIRDAVLRGAGAAALPLSLVKADIEAGRLASWGVLEGGKTEIWVLHTSRRLTSGKVAAFVQFLCDRFRQIE